MTIPTRIESLTGPSRGYELNDGTNLPEPHYTPEKGGWRVCAKGCVQPADMVDYRNDRADHVLCVCGETTESWFNACSKHWPIAYLAKPACICPEDEYGCRIADKVDCPRHPVKCVCTDPPLIDAHSDCPACNRVGEGPIDCQRCGSTPAPVNIHVHYSTGPRDMVRMVCQCGAIGKCRPDRASAIASWSEPWQAYVEGTPTARARCESAGLVVMERRTRKDWRVFAGNESLHPNWVDYVTRALGLILPDDGETK